MVTAAFVQQVTFLYTDDAARSFRFYEEVVGLTLVLDQGPARIYRVAGESFLGVCETSSVQQGPPADRQPGGVIVTFVCRTKADVDAWHRRLIGRGVVFEKAPAENARYRIYNAFFRDPDGYLLEIQAFLDPAWPTPKD
jgi:catechol 2,3-dioxygenase-like lactoylglutathione lyase family enzyme